MTGLIFVDGIKLSLNPFITTHTANLIDAIARSLKSPEGNRIEVRLRDEEVGLQVDGQEIPLNIGQAQRIISNLLRGFIQSLHGAESGTEFRFLCER